MKLFWGDIHNHCGISYGYGSLENALRNAKNHLDFCAITGHAMWPDMYDKTDETAFVVGFHTEGFAKFNRLWEEHVKKLISESNDDDFVTFQAYEMHSCEYGDHHIVSPDDSLPLFYPQSPRELVEKSGCRALTVAHHIGYTPNYRGIDWQKHDNNITPLIEVCSKHGCAMSETAPYAYYHNMGPRDSHNTVYEGLKQGKHIGFVGSTDHHAGFPGSYGDGKMAVWAEEKTRESIWDAMINRRTYAVTGDRIGCEFSVNDHPMGSVIKDCDKDRDIFFDVTACYNIDKIVVYKNLVPIDITEGLLLANSSNDTKFKLRIEMGWGNNSDEVFAWNGKVSVNGGTIVDAEPCFRGRSVLAPSSLSTDGHDDANDIDSKILEQSENAVSWQCYTLKNTTPMHPQTTAMIIEIQGSTDSTLTIDVNGHIREVKVGELIEYGYSEHMKYFHSQAFKVHPIISESNYHVTKHIKDTSDNAKDFYHLEVYQRNGSCAFVTPVYCE